MAICGGSEEVKFVGILNSLTEVKGQGGAMSRALSPG